MIMIADPRTSYKSGISLNIINPNTAPDISWEYWIGANTLDSKNLEAIVRQFPPIPQIIPHNNKINVSLIDIEMWLLIDSIPLINAADKKA